MSQNNRLRFLLCASIQLLIIGVTCLLSYHFVQHFSIIPKAVLHLPDVYVSQKDMHQILKIFVVTYAIQILISYWKYGVIAFDNATRFANEYVFYLVAYTTASLYLFLATTINYDPQLIAAIGLFSTVFYLIGFAVFASMSKAGGVVNLFFVAIGITAKRMVSISGVLAAVYFLTPLIMGKAFTSDRDIANAITQVRIWFNPVESSDWGFKNRLPGQVFAQPLLIKQAPNDDQSLYILERGGKIYRLPSTTGGEPVLLLDVSASMGEVEMENGALGFDFHPKFNDSENRKPYIYLYYTDTRPEEVQHNRVSRFDLSSDDAVVNTQSELVLMNLEREPSGFHNGGEVLFGPDGFLYIGFGEGVYLPNAKTSDKVLRSGVIRIDVDMDPSRSIPAQPFEYGTIQHYYVPKDNPFVDNDAIRNEYYALGLRNPFRFHFDPLTQEIWLGDIGSTIWEEVNKIEKGKHYQFPVIEGYKESGVEGWESLGLPEQGPVYTYEHNAYDRAVIGGVVNRSDYYPELQGKYIFADNYSAKLFVMDSDKERVEQVDFIARADQYAQRGISSVMQLRSGEILVTTLGAASEPSGEVLQLVHADQADVFRDETTDNTPEGYDDKATAALFAVNCGRCHGVNGDGKGPDSALLGVPIPDLTSPLFHHSRSADDIKKVIVEGGAAVGKSPLMPPWGGFLKPREIDHLVTYIQSLPDKHHHH